MPFLIRRPSVVGFYTEHLNFKGSFRVVYFTVLPEEQHKANFYGSRFDLFSDSVASYLNSD